MSAGQEPKCCAGQGWPIAAVESWPVAVLRAGDPAKICPRAVEFSPRPAKPDTLLAMGAEAVHVSAAVMEDVQGRVLLTRRGDDGDLAGAWEFPGGKREPGDRKSTRLNSSH